MRDKGRIFCGLDIGTSKTCIVVVRKFKDERLEVAGSGFSLSQGLIKSVIVNLREVTDSVGKAARELEAKSALYAELSHPIYAGAVGLAILNARNMRRRRDIGSQQPAKFSLMNKLISWLKE
jgi:cell division ATPase FtsA